MNKYWIINPNNNIVRDYKSRRTEMEPGDLEGFKANVDYYEAAANLFYTNGEPNINYAMFGDAMANGDFMGALRALGVSWSEASKDPGFYLSVATSIAGMGNSMPSSKVGKFASELKNWIGKDARVITNKSSDIIFLSKSGNRRIRFDIKNPSPHKNPHVHIEERNSNGNWKGVRSYPKDVLPE